VSFSSTSSSSASFLDGSAFPFISSFTINYFPNYLVSVESNRRSIHTQTHEIFRANDYVGVNFQNSRQY
jgi:hypothetical protein